MSDRQVTAQIINAAFNCGESPAAQLAIELTESEAAAINNAGKNLRRVEQLVEKARQRIADTDAAIQFAERHTANVRGHGVVVPTSVYLGATGPASALPESPTNPDPNEQPEGLADPVASDPATPGPGQTEASDEPTVVTGEALAEPVAPKPADSQPTISPEMPG